MVISLVKELIAAWDTDKPARLAAGLAYYGIFSVAPFIYVSLTVAGIFLDEVLLANELYIRIESLLGEETAQLVQGLISQTATTTSGGSIFATVIGFLVLVYAATGLFANLKYALNSIWHVPPAEYSGTLAFVKTRLLAFLIVIGFGLLLVVAAFFSLVFNWFGEFIPLIDELGIFSNLPITILVFVCLSIFYRILPDTKVAWRDVWLPAFLTTLVYSLVIWVVSVILGGFNLTSAFGAAGAFAVLLTAIYYIAQIFLLGGMFSVIYANRFGSRKNSDSSL